MLGKRKSYYVENGIIHFAFEYGKGSLEVLTDNIVNVFVPFECEEHRSKAIEGEKSVIERVGSDRKGYWKIN